MIRSGSSNGRPANQHRVDEGEDRGVDADAQRQRQRGDQREPLVLDQQTDGELKVLPEAHAGESFQAGGLTVLDTFTLNWGN